MPNEKSNLKMVGGGGGGGALIGHAEEERATGYIPNVQWPHISPAAFTSNPRH
jgi:hypothetical protein